MRSRIALAVSLVLLSGCGERKELSFAQCHRIFVRPLPATSGPDELAMRGVDLCMQGRGYKRDQAACGSIAGLGSACYSPHWLWYPLSVFG